MPQARRQHPNPTLPGATLLPGGANAQGNPRTQPDPASSISPPSQPAPVEQEALDVVVAQAAAPVAQEALDVVVAQPTAPMEQEAPDVAAAPAASVEQEAPDVVVAQPTAPEHAGRQRAGGLHGGGEFPKPPRQHGADGALPARWMANTRTTSLSPDSGAPSRLDARLREAPGHAGRRRTGGLPGSADSTPGGATARGKSQPRAPPDPASTPSSASQPMLVEREVLEAVAAHAAVGCPGPTAPEAQAPGPPVQDRSPERGDPPLPKDPG